MSHPMTPVAAPARIPADVELPDKVLGPLTARQLSVLAASGGVLYGLWQATRTVVPVVVFLAVAVPVLAAAAVLVVLRRDGMTLDRLLLAAIRHHTAGTHHLTAPATFTPAPPWLAAAATSGADVPARPRAWRSPVRDVTGSAPSGGQEAGVVDLGADGLVVMAAASTVNFALRTPAEQEALVVGFGRYLHSLTAPVQVLIRAERVDLTATVQELRALAEQLPDPGLARLAHDHADFVAGLGEQTELLRRQVLLVWRDPLHARPARNRRHDEHAGPQTRRAAEDRLARRVAEATELLAPIGITVAPLDPAQATAVLAAAVNPGLPLPPSPAGAGHGEIITGTGWAHADGRYTADAGDNALDDPASMNGRGGKWSA